MTVFCRVATIVIAAIWWGGLTFYSLFVIPIGTHVLNSSEQQGRITQQVSNSLNILGIVAFLVFVWNSNRSYASASRHVRQSLWVSLSVFAIAQLTLIAMHFRLDNLLATSGDVYDHEHFYSTHRYYLIAVAVLWHAGFAYFPATVAMWRAEDKLADGR